MGPLALLALGLGGAGLASVIKKKGLDLKKKEGKKVAKEIAKKKKYVPEWQTKPDTKKLEEQRERAKKNKKRFLDKLKDYMN
jgi:replication initiation and membrane attachment protein DnaB